MTFLSKRILPTLAVLAVACAQVFGLERGFACDHGDELVETTAEHCHRVLADAHEEEVPCHESPANDCGDSGEKEHHTPLSVDMQAAPSSLASVSTPAFVAVPMVEFELRDWILSQVLAAREFSKIPPDTGGNSPPSAAVQVASCMVILV